MMGELIVTFAWDRKTQLSECSTVSTMFQFLSDRQETQDFIPFGFSTSRARRLIIPWPRGLINSDAGQLKHIGCDQVCVTDNEVTQNAALDRENTHSRLPSDLAANGAGSPGCGAGSG